MRVSCEVFDARIELLSEGVFAELQFVASHAQLVDRAAVGARSFVQLLPVALQLGNLHDKNTP